MLIRANNSSHFTVFTTEKLADQMCSSANNEKSAAQLGLVKDFPDINKKYTYCLKNGWMFFLVRLV